LPGGVNPDLTPPLVSFPSRDLTLLVWSELNGRRYTYNVSHGYNIANLGFPRSLVSQILRALPQFPYITISNVYTPGVNDNNSLQLSMGANSHYNGHQLTFDKRLGHGVQVQAKNRHSKAKCSCGSRNRFHLGDCHPRPSHRC
jgi:hypothetical protein